MRTLLGCVCLLGALVGIPAVATAQTVYNPTKLQFDSIDHATITAYTVEIWLLGVDPATGAPISTMSAVKSKVTSSGLPTGQPQLQLLFTDLTPLPSYPAGQSYVMRVVAVGADGVLTSPRSAPSGPFARALAPASVTGLVVK